MRSEPRKINVDLSSSFKQQLVIINQLCNWVVLNYLLPCSVSQLLTSVSFVSPAGAEPPEEQGQAASLVSEGDGVRFSYLRTVIRGNEKHGTFKTIAGQDSEQMQEQMQLRWVCVFNWTWREGVPWEWMVTSNTHDKSPVSGGVSSQLAWREDTGPMDAFWRVLGWPSELTPSRSIWCSESQ